MVKSTNFFQTLGTVKSLCKSGRDTVSTYQGEYHPHDNGNKDEIESGDLQEAAVMVGVGVNILVLDRRLQPSHALAL